MCETQVNGRKRKIKNQSRLETKIKPFLYILSFAILPILVVIILCFALLRGIVNFILKIKHKNDYGGLMCSSDAVWTVEDNISPSIVNAVFMLEYKEEENFFQKFNNKINENVGKFPKLSSIRKQFLGYPYFLTNKVSVSECTRKINEHIRDEEDLKDFLSKICNAPLPKDGRATWECYIGTKGITWQNNRHHLRPIICRLHHTLGDGMTLLNLLQKGLFGSALVEEKFFKKTRHSDKGPFEFDLSRFVYGFVHKVTGFLQILQMVFIAPLRVAQMTFLRPPDKNELSWKFLSGEKIVVWTTEPVVDLVPVCKDIRRQLNIRFTDIVFAAIGGSFNEYFKRNGLQIPEYITAGVPVLTVPNSSRNDLEVKNNITFITLDLPVSVEPFSMWELLQEASRQTHKVAIQRDAQIVYWLLNYIVGVFPVPLLSIVLKNDLPVGISNLPASETSFLGESEIKDVAFFPPNRGFTGVTIAIASYNNRFQIMLLVDKVLISSKNEAQKVVDDILESMKVLNEERKDFSGNNKVDRKTELELKLN